MGQADARVGEIEQTDPAFAEQAKAWQAAGVVIVTGGIVYVVSPIGAAVVEAGAVASSGEGIRGATGGLAGVPGRVQSRINLKNSAWSHVVDRHFNPAKNASQFTISKGELHSLLQSKNIVGTPVTRTLNSADGIRYVREINVGRNIGLDKFNNMQPTSTMTVLSDKFGNLVTATPGIIK